MKTFKTKYFGEITVDDDDFSDVVYENTGINIFFSDMKLYGDKIKTCIDMLDKYLEINNIAKKSIIENFLENERIHYYFECHFDLLEKRKTL
jgi:ABC-type multidrug transport system fused ATPase/permease subunit